MVQEIFDRRLLRMRRTKRAHDLASADFLTDDVVEDLLLRLSAVQRSFPRVAVIGAGGAGHRLLSTLRARAGTELVVELDVASSLFGGTPGATGGQRVVSDFDALAFAPASLDLVVAPLVLSGVNDLPGTLVQIRRALRPDGLFMGVLFGSDTLTELRQTLLQAEADIVGGVRPRVAPFADVRTLGSLLQRAGFTLPVTDRNVLTVRYPHVLKLMHDLRAAGAANALVERSGGGLTRAVLVRAGELYAERFSDPDGRLRATVELVTLTGWSPDASQQQPLKPGSATARLADALGTTEQSAGDTVWPTRSGGS